MFSNARSIAALTILSGLVAIPVKLAKPYSLLATALKRAKPCAIGR